MKRLVTLLLLAVAVAAAYLYPPFGASRLYLHPYWATNPRADVAHYPMAGYFALFGSDSLNSIRMYRSPADSMPYFRLVTKEGDTVRFNRGGIYTTGDLWAQTVHYTTLDPAPAGSNDSLKRGLWFLSRGTWAKCGESLAADSGAVHSAGNSWWLGILGKASDAFGADSADVGVVSRSCTGQAATVATIAGLTADTAVAAGRASDLVGAAADSIKFWAGDGTMRLRSSWNMPQTLTDGATINWSLALGGCAKVTLGGNRTLANPTNIVNGTKVQLFIVQDSTGSRTLTWGSHYKFCGGTTAPTLTATGWPTPGGDLFEFVCYSDTLLYFANFCPAIWP